MRSFRASTPWVVFFIAVAVAPLASSAPQRASPQDAAALLRSNPDLAAQVRSRLRDSGLTPDQIRARLRDEGYPEDLLDPYLQSGTVSDSSTVTDPRVT